MIKKFSELSQGSFFKMSGKIYSKIEDQVDDRTGDISGNAVCLSREAQGGVVYICSSNEVTLLPNMKH